jgi:biotin transport system substrate-specific component
MEISRRPATLIDVVVPGQGIARDVALVVGFTVLVSVFAQIAVKLPFTPVPFTGQTLAVLLTGGALGAWRGGASLGLYALLGTIGIPVFAPSFAGAEGSMIHVIFPWNGTGDQIWNLTSGGYIVGFIAAAFAVGKLAERGWDRGWLVIFAMLIGNVILYVPGLIWLAYKIDSFDNALVFGLYPFIVGDLMKLYVAAVALPGAWEFIGRKQR